MGSAAWLTSAVAAADAATQALGLQEDVTHEAFLANAGGMGEADYAAPVLRKALVERKQGKLSGQEQSFRATVTFLRPVAVTARDRITLWDGLTGPILEPEGGLSNPATGAPFVRTVHLG